MKRRKQRARKRIWLCLLILLGMAVFGKIKRDQKAADIKKEELIKEKASKKKVSQKKPDSVLSDLQTRLENTEKQNANRAVFVEDYTTKEKLILNSRKMESASLIKLFIAGAVCEDYAKVAERLSEETLCERMRLMICVSDNRSADVLTMALAPSDGEKAKARVTAFCKAHGYNDTEMNAFIDSSDFSGYNYTSARDVGKYLEDLYTGKLAGSEEILEFMKAQERREKIPAGLPKGVLSANKTGELSDVQHDAAIIYLPYRTYSLCVMEDDVLVPVRAVEDIQEVSRAVYHYMENVREKKK